MAAEQRDAQAAHQRREAASEAEETPMGDATTEKEAEATEAADEAAIEAAKARVWACVDMLVQTKVLLRDLRNEEEQALGVQNSTNLSE